MAVRAPDFRPELEWINTGGKTLSLRDFRGRLLLLDFWTYGCINCLHLAPEVAAVERRFPDELAVVGVHAGKFVAERSTEAIARACERLGIGHPVVNDRQFRTWREYAVGAWPTLVLVSPDGYEAARHVGEISAERLSALVEAAREAARAKGTLSPGVPIPHSPARLEPESGVLRFPGRVLATPDGSLFVADTGHHRILRLVPASDGSSATVANAWGTGTAGLVDGAGATAAFHAPQGMTLHGDTLFVADAGNHAIRAIHLTGGGVTTVAGTGAQARRRHDGGPAREVPLASPWDVLWRDGRLVFAMAGFHQLWTVAIGGEARPWVGSGAEALHDGEDRASAALAQPVALAADGARLHFACTEASAVRTVRADGRVETIVGTGLFDFGDRDGAGDEARLQHVAGIAWWAERETLLVADAYNHRVKTVDPRARTAAAFAGSGEAGFEDGQADVARFREPGGVSVAAGGRTAWVADTNNHALRAVDLRTRHVRTVAVRER